MDKTKLMVIGLIVAVLIVIGESAILFSGFIAEQESKKIANATQYGISLCLNQTILGITQATLANNGTITLPLIVDKNGTIRQGYFRYEGLA